MLIENFQLSQLQIAPENARKTRPGTIIDIAASIKAHGLEQNLVGYRKQDEIFISAGGRRLAALQQLHDAGELPPDLAADGIPVKIKEQATTREASLAENTQRENMHPADEFMAFRSLITEQGLTTGEVADRFGKSEKYVEQRMRLGNVAPELLDVYRAGAATLEQMMALSIVDDHAAQTEAWKAGGGNDYFRRPDQLRDALVERDVSLSSPIGTFVGVDAYEAAGGEPRRDLFSDFVTLPDSKLVQKLAKSKLDTEVAKVKAKGWGWVEAKPEFDYAARSKYRQRSGAAPSDKMGAVVTIGSSGKVEVVAGLLKPGEKGPTEKGAAKKKPAEAKSDVRATVASLVGIRTGAIASALRDDSKTAVSVLAAALASSYFRNFKDDLPEMLGIEFGGYTNASQAPWIKLTDPTGADDHAVWEKRVKDGEKKHGSVLAWLLLEPKDVVWSLLAFLGADAIDTDVYSDSGKDAVHAFVKAIGIDIAAAWTVTPEWLAKQPKAYVLDAVTEAAGKDAAKELEKGKAKDLTACAHAILIEKAWVPEQLRSPEPPKPKPAPAKKKTAAEKSVAPGKKAVKKAAPKTKTAKA